MSVTLKQVAAKLNLSIGLVSGVLNDRPNVWASEATRQRIYKAAKEMGYRPNAAARALSTRRANAIAFVYTASHDVEYSEMMGIFARSLNACGSELIVRVLDTREQVLANLTELVRSHACDGAILWGVETEVDEQALLLEKLGAPFIAKGRHEQTHPNWPQVDFDHEAMMQQAVEYLAALGHRRIAYLGYAADAPFRYCLRAGFRSAIQETLGSSPSPELIGEGSASAAYAQEQMLAWLSLPLDRQPTALVIGANSQAWLGVELALARRGIVIGDTGGGFAVTGITSTELTLLFGQARAYSHIVFAELANALVQKLLPSMLAGESIAEPIVRVRPALHSLNSLRLLEQGLFPAPLDTSTVIVRQVQRDLRLET